MLIIPASPPPPPPPLSLSEDPARYVFACINVCLVCRWLRGKLHISCNVSQKFRHLGIPPPSPRPAPGLFQPPWAEESNQGWWMYPSALGANTGVSQTPENPLTSAGCAGGRGKIVFGRPPCPGSAPNPIPDGAVLSSILWRGPARGRCGCSRRLAGQPEPGRGPSQPGAHLFPFGTPAYIHTAIHTSGP